MIYTRKNEFDQRMSAMPAAKPTSDVGFAQAFTNSFSLALMDNNTIARQLTDDITQTNTEKILQLNRDGLITDDEIEYFALEKGNRETINWKALSNYIAYQKPALGVLSPIEINKRLRTKYKEAAAKVEHDQDGASFYTKTGALAGAGLGVMADPVVIASMFVGLGPAAHALKWTARFGRGFLTAAGKTVGAELALETIRQSTIYSFKSNIGVDYSFEEAFKNVALTAGVAGGVAGTMGGLVSALKRPTALVSKLDDPTSKAAKNNLEAVSREAKQFPPDTPAEENLAKVEVETKYHNENPAFSENIDEAIPDDQIDEAFEKATGGRRKEPTKKRAKKKAAKKVKEAVAETETELGRMMTKIKLDDAAGELDKAALERKAKLQIIKEKDVQDYLKLRADAVDPSKAKKEVRLAAMDLIGRTTNRSGRPSLEGHIFAKTRYYLSKLEEMTNAYRVRRFGLQWDREGQYDLIREIFKTGSSGDEDVKAYGTMVKSVFKDLMDDFNKAGGHIKELKDFRVPLRHDPVKLGRSSYEEWRRFIEDKIDMERLVFGGSVSEKQREVLLQAIYKSLSTDRISALRIRGLPKAARKAIANYHRQHRILHFNTADDWIAYADKYGPTRPVNAIYDHVDMMAREIAAMEKFGPNPDDTIQKIMSAVKDVTGTKFSRLETMYNLTMARGLTDNIHAADWAQTIRNISAIPKLGMAAVSAVGDTVLTALTAQANAMPIFKTFTRFLKNLNPNFEGDRRVLMQIGVGSDYVMDRLRTGTRISAATGYGYGARTLDAVIRLSGLNAMTFAGKHAFSFEMVSNISKLLDDVPWGKLPKKVASKFNEYGISPDDWATLQKAGRVRYGDLNLVDFTRVSSDTTTSKFVSLIHDETILAVPEPNARVKSFMLGSTKAGTFTGEMVRMFGQLKAFPLSVLMLHFQRASQMGGFAGGAYAFKLFGGLTMMGGLTLMAKDALKGKTPSDPTTLDFWRAALAQGGGLGILGDYLSADPNRTGAMFRAVVAPTWSDAEKLGASLLTAPVDPAKAGAKAVKFGTSMVPGQMWFTKLLMERYAFDFMNKMADPYWDTKQRAMRSRMRKERGQEWWWKPGKTQP